MDETLQRLLIAEKKAEQIARQAEDEREHIIQSALLEAKNEEERFEARIPELHSAFINKAEARADQVIHELRRRYDERLTQLRELAESREEEAIETAFNLLISPENKQ